MKRKIIFVSILFIFVLASQTAIGSSVLIGDPEHQLPGGDPWDPTGPIPIPLPGNPPGK